MTSYQVRPIRAEEWREVRALRLTALQDDAAAVAFLQTYDESIALPDEFWQERARGSSVDAAGPEPTARQWVAITEAGEWVGTTVALVERPGDPGAIAPVTQPAGHLVGVYIHPDHRGTGLLGRLFDAATNWSREQGLPLARLFVHADNARAQSAYRKLGFSPTGVTTTLAFGLEREMVRPL